jgi:hypothetical protein
LQAAVIAASVDTILLVDDGEYAAVLTAVAKNLTITGNAGAIRTVTFSTVTTWSLDNIPADRQIKIIGVNLNRPASTSSALIDLQYSTVSFSNLYIFGTRPIYGELLSGYASTLVFDNVALNGVSAPQIIGNGFGMTTVMNSRWFNCTGVGILSSAVLVRNSTFQSWTGSIFRGTSPSAGNGICRFSKSRFLNVNAVSNSMIDLSMAECEILMDDCEIDGVTNTGSAPPVMIVALFAGPSTILRSNFSNIVPLVPDFAVSFGGAITLETQLLTTIDSCRFINCGADLVAGGAVVLFNVRPDITTSNAVVRNSYFANSRGRIGGALYAQGQRSLLIENSIFQNNMASQTGGAIAIGTSAGGTLQNATIAGCIFRSNLVRVSSLSSLSGDTSIASGGAVAIDGPLETLIVRSNSFLNNSAVHSLGWANGGALHVGAYFEIKNSIVAQNTFDSNIALGWEPATGGGLSINGISSITVSNNRFSNNSAAILASSPGFFDPMKRLSFGGGAFIAGFAASDRSTTLSLSGTSFDSNSAGQAGALHLQEVSAVAFNSSFISNRAKAGAGGIMLMYSKLLQVTPRSVVSFGTMNFSSNVLENGDTVRSSNCSRRGLQNQQTFSIDCLSCDFGPSQGFNGVESLPYGAHIGSVGGELFSLAGPASKLISPPIYECNRPGGFSCFIAGDIPPRIVQVLPDHTGLVIAFESQVQSLAANVNLPYCENLLSNDTLTQPFWDRATSRCTLDKRGYFFTVRAASLPYPGFISFVADSVTFDRSPVSTDAFGITPAVSAPRFRPIIVATQTLDPCADTPISGADSIIPGVFPPVYNWTVAQSLPFEAAVVAFLNAQNVSAFVLPFSLWTLSSSPRSITLVLRVSSAGQPYSLPVNVTFAHPGDPTPEIFLEGPTERKQFAALETQLNARVLVPTCLSLRGVAVTKEWSLVAGNPSSLIMSPWNSQSYYLAASSMVAGQNYTFRFTASASSGSSSISRSIDVVVEAIYSPILLFSSGDGGYISLNQRMDLEVSIIDPDNSVRRPSFIWDMACFTPGNATVPPPVLPSSEFTNPYRFPRYYCDCTTFTFGSTANYSIAAGTIPPREYTALLVSSKDSRSSTTSIRLNVTNAATPYLRIRLTPRWNGPKPSSAERIAVSATVEGAGLLNPSLYRAEWKVFQNAEELVGLASPQFVTTPTDGAALVIAFKPNTFSSGSKYVVQLSIYDRPSSTLRGRNWIDVEINDSPTGGSVSISPSQVSQFGSVTVSMPGWVDSDSPLRYTLSLVLGQSSLGEDEILLTDLVDVQKTSATIPFAGNLTLRTRIIDALGSATVVDSFINVAPGPTEVNIIEDLQALLQIGDLRRASGLFVALSSTSNTTIRAIVAQSLQTFVSQTRLTASNSLFVLRMLQRLNVSTFDSIPVKIAAVDLITAVVDSVYNSTSFGASAFTLLSEQSTAGSVSLKTVVSVTANTLRSFQAALAAFLDKERMTKLVSSSFKLSQVMSRVSLLNETATTASSSVYEILSLVRCGDQSLRFNMGGSAISVDPDAQRNCSLGRGVAFDAFTYLNGSFPAIFYYNSSSTVAEPSLVPVICIGVRPLEPEITPTSWNTTVTLSNVAIPNQGANISVTPSCVRFDTSSLTWSTDGCSLISASNGEFTCQCSVLSVSSSAIPPSQPPKSVLLSIAFGSFTNAPDVLLPTAPTFPPYTLTPDGKLPPGIPPEALNPTNGADATGSGGLSTVGIAAIAAASAVVVVASVIAIVVFSIRKRNNDNERLRVQRAISSQGTTTGSATPTGAN